MPQQHTYYVNEVLAEANLLPEKIKDAIGRLDLDRIYPEVITSPKVKAEAEEFIVRARASYQSVNDLINRHWVLKRALIRFNAGCVDSFVPTNTVEVLGHNYTIAEIIERKKNLNLYENLLSKLESINLKWEMQLERENKEYQRNLETFISNQQAALKESKRDEAKVAEWTASFSPTNQPVRLDPIGLLKEIDRVREYIDSFSNKLDMSLSRLNATCQIAITT